MKKLLTYLVLISTSFCMPVYGQEATSIVITPFEENYDNEEEKLYMLDGIAMPDKFKEIILQSSESRIKYCNRSNVNIRTEPNTNCDVIDQLLLNTSVEVIAEYDGWSCITNETGIGFVKSDFLQDNEIHQIELGRFKITHYCCENYNHICGGGKGITSLGTPVRPGVISVDPKIIPLGSKVMINGKVYTAEDTGGRIKGNAIDMAVSIHQQALELGVYYAPVYLIVE